MFKYLAVRCILAGIIIGLAALASFWLALTFAIIWALIAEIGVWCLADHINTTETKRIEAELHARFNPPLEPEEMHR